MTKQKNQSAFTKHLHETHRIFVQSLNPNLKNFFEGLNDFFFDMAEQAESNALQNQYFAAIGDTRKNKDELTRQFATNVNVIFQKFKSKDFVYFIENDEQTEQTKKNLTLIKEDDLDQKLAINNVIAKISQYYHEELYMLNERYSELVGMGGEIDNHANPIGPDAIVNAFALSLKVLKSENNIKLMIIKLFEKNMVESLGPAYRMVNKYFKKSGILPEIKFEVKQQPSAGHAMNNSINYLAHALSEEDENYKKIASILEHDREQAPQQSYSAENIVQFSQLTDALDQIKVELLTDQELESQQSISPLELKDELIKKLKSLKAMSKNQQLNAADENIIDLVGEMFQFLVEDRNLPETIQLVLSKLQLPYLQIALKDETFFSDKHNNARQLLNIMAESSIGWSPETDDNQVFLNKVKEIVNFILKNHEKSINYEKLIERFIRFDQKLKKRASIAERRTSETVSGRERLSVAKNRTAEVLKKHLKDQKVPKLVREILLKPWANVLILSELRKDDSPDLLFKHQDFVRKLVNAANPDNPNKRSDAAIKELCDEMVEGLKLVAYDIKDLREKSQEMQTCLEEINGVREPEKPLDFIDPKEILKLSKEFNRDSSVGELIENPDLSMEPPPGLKLVEDDAQESASSLKLGEWIEINSKKKPQRVKLSWISPISGKMLFVDAKGAKVIDLFPIELADQLRKNQSRLLQQVPIMDRAMSSIAEKMKQRKAAAAGK
ncbi:DUF1631 family protein [Marinicella meishanensis]|uniref:DUF1631 family protein n=1 Tax=Marinicella meishanensis TaxID=2873263 RepID=UPI001CBFAB10|nr:DUF1631 family protein [Marinicella sp. NBU2979]